ncbi:putative membrane protein YqjE [Rathayibacter agropyri]
MDPQNMKRHEQIGMALVENRDVRIKLIGGAIANPRGFWHLLWLLNFIFCCFLLTIFGTMLLAGLSAQPENPTPNEAAAVIIPAILTILAAIPVVWRLRRLIGRLVAFTFRAIWALRTPAARLVSALVVKIGVTK